MMDTVRVTLVVASLGTGGAERTASEVADGLAASAARVTVVTLDSSVADHFRLDPRVHRVGINIFWPARHLLHAAASAMQRILLLRRTLVATRPDVVLSLADVTNVRVLMALTGTGIPVVASERSNPMKHPIGEKWEKLRRLLYPRAACIVTQTEAVAAWARSFVDHGRVAVIPNFTRTLARPPRSPSLRGMRTVLSVGRLGREKGHDLLIAAFAHGGLHLGGWQLVIVGDGPERDRLIQQGQSLGLGSSLLLPGRTDAVADQLHDADIFVLPSRYEGFPNALLEAMAAGLPCVACDCDFGPRELIENGVNGLLVPPDDVPRLGDAIAQLARDAVLRDTLAREALRVHDRFARAAVIDRWSQVLERSAHARSNARRRSEEKRSAVSRP